MQSVCHEFAIFAFYYARREFLREFALAHIKDGREGMGDKRLIVCDQRGIRTNGFDRNARGENVGVHVQDVTPSWRLPKLALRVVFQFGDKFVVPQHLKIHEAIAQTRKCRAQKKEQQKSPADLLFVVHPKTASRPWRSVPHPTASRAAAKIALLTASAHALA